MADITLQDLREILFQYVRAYLWLVLVSVVPVMIAVKGVRLQHGLARLPGTEQPMLRPKWNWHLFAGSGISICLCCSCFLILIKTFEAQKWHGKASNPLTEVLPLKLTIASKVLCVRVFTDKPDPPAGTPCASDIRSSSLTLSWYGSSYDGGSAVQSYTVEIWNSVDNKWTDLTTCRSTSFNVQDLQADREYKFRVRAANVYGISEPSQESEVVKVGEKQEG